MSGSLNYSTTPLLRDCLDCGPLPITRFNRRAARKDGLSPRCRECEGARLQAWREANPEKRKAQDKRTSEDHRRARLRYNERHPGRNAARNRNWRKANPAKVVTYNQNYNAERPDRLRHDRAKWEAWELSNSEKVKACNRARALRRLSRKRMACPAWADMEKIDAVYAEAVRIQEETGTPHHVDHIIPLAGKNVCGLHVHWNLQVLQAIDNLKKGIQYVG